MLSSTNATRNMTIFLAFPFLSVLSDFVAASSQPESPLAAWVADKVQSDFSGVVLVARGDAILFEKGFGLADVDNNLPFTTNTVIDTLSITKQFTAAAILKLEEQGALSVHDTLDRFFDNIPASKRSITLHHLLTHTSGLKANYKYDYRKVTRDALEKNALGSWLRSEPGEEYRYSNVGYSLLGIVIERVSGKGYEQFLHENLFRPAGMNQTGYRIPNWTSEELVVGYRSRAVSFRGWLASIANWMGQSDRWGTPLDQYWAEDGPWWNLRGNGGLLSTLSDLHRWHLALENNLILSEEQKIKLFTPYVEEHSDTHTFYAYGWFVHKPESTIREIYHPGGNPYFFSAFHRFIEDDLLFLFFTNDWDVVRSGQVNELLDVISSEYSQHKE